MRRSLLLEAAPPDGGGITINFPTIDWSQLVPQLVSLFFDAIGKWFTTTLHSVFDGLWSGDHNVIGTTPLAMTWGFGPCSGAIGRHPERCACGPAVCRDPAQTARH